MKEETSMYTIKRLVPAIGASIALALGGIGVAQASHGADDPPGHDAKDDHGHHGGKHHHHGHHHHHHGGKHHHGANHQ
jgi:hypothetical protein